MALPTDEKTPFVPVDILYFSKIFGTENMVAQQIKQATRELLLKYSRPI